MVERETSSKSRQTGNVHSVKKQMKIINRVVKTMAWRHHWRRKGRTWRTTSKMKRSIRERERETDTYARLAITTTQPNYYVAFHSVSSTWKKTFENVCRENQRCLCLLFSVAVLCHTTRRHRFSIIFSIFRNANLYPFFCVFVFFFGSLGGWMLLDRIQ